MGNSASSLPFSIGAQVGAPADHGGWSVHKGQRKADGVGVTVFKATNKSQLAKTSVMVGKTSTSSQLTMGGSGNLSQLAPVYHHYVHCKKLRHPYILQVYATLDTDNPTAASAAAAPSAAGAGGADSVDHTVNVSAMSAQTGDFIVVTEACIPLDQWLSNREQPPTPEQVAWGLQCMVESLHFLHNSAKLAHGNVSPSSFWVTMAGDIKLWNFSLCTAIGIADGGGGPTRHFRDYEAYVTPNLYRSPERQQRQYEALASNGIHCMDSYSLGLLIPHLYHQQVPPALVKAVQRLQTPTLKMRPRLQPLLKCPIFDSPYHKLQMQLTEISVQPVEQKIAFWQTLHTNYLQNYSTQQQQHHHASSSINESLAVYKILPLITTNLTQICSSESMLSQDLYRREVMAMLGPLFFVAEQFLVPKASAAAAPANPDTAVTPFQQHIGPLIALLFNVNDRGVRGVLLQKATLLSQQLDKNSLNSAVFEPMCGGFSDSSAALRELTLKATLVMVPRLTPPNLEKLSRYLQRLQTDPEASIRTNTVIFVSKLAPHLGDISRQKLLLPAYARAMKDGFPPCRLAALQATLRSKEFFTAEDVANRVLPAVMPQLLDPMADVRKEAFSIVDALLVVLRDESARMNMRDADAGVAGGNVPPGGGMMSNSSGGSSNMVPPGASKTAGTTPAPSAAGAPSSGGYFGLSSWMGSSSTAKAAPVAPSAPSSVPVVSTPFVSAAPMMNAPPPPHHQQQMPIFSTLSLSDTGIGAGSSNAMNHQLADDGWDDDEDLLGLGQSNFTSTTTAPAPAAPASFRSGASGMVNSNDDFFSSAFDNNTSGMNTLAAGKRPLASGGKLIMPKARVSTATKPVMGMAAAAPIATKLQLDNDDTNWDDF